MTTTRHEVRTFITELHCDQCGGDMKSTSSARLTSPPTYEHECRQCGHIEWMNRVYPATDYEKH